MPYSRYNTNRYLPLLIKIRSEFESTLKENIMGQERNETKFAVKRLNLVRAVCKRFERKRCNG